MLQRVYGMNDLEYDYIDFLDEIENDWLSDEFSDSIPSLLCSSVDFTTCADTDSEATLKPTCTDTIFFGDSSTTTSITTCMTSSSTISATSPNKASEASSATTTTPFSSTQRSYYVAKNLRKARGPKVIWSLKNCKKGKTYEDYVIRQLQIARRLCKQTVKLFNDHDIENFVYFARNMFVEDFIFREKITGVNPFNKNQIDSDRIIQGLGNMLLHFQSFVSGVPDSTIMVDNIEVFSEGKRVVMKGKVVGTPLKHVIFPEHLQDPPRSINRETKIMKSENGVTHSITEMTTTVTAVNTNSVDIDYSNPDNIITFEYPLTLTFLLDKKNKLKRLELVTE